mmetsp:Transcript_27415/g.33488  ORF Transcript_27415/g.33488 Transcript_27415/m.33488 type:complete len:250 (+) Transcript_27415:512-1261(+)
MVDAVKEAGKGTSSLETKVKYKPHVGKIKRTAVTQQRVSTSTKLKVKDRKKVNVEKVKKTRKEGIRTVEDALKEFEHLLRNEFVGEAYAKKAELRIQAKTGETTRCTCDPFKDVGCGPESNCPNRELQIECTKHTCELQRLKKKCLNNRLRKRKYNLGELRMSGKKGIGMFSLNKKPAGTFIVEYCGEVVTQKECMRRLGYDYIGEKHKYLMVLTRDLVVDATRKGNYARFINHSCEPNCEVDIANMFL